MNIITIGENEYRYTYKPIRISELDRLRHMYAVGKTGVGKSSLYLQMCMQDICNFRGVCFIDPHGDGIDWLLEHMPKSRLEDVVVLRPSDTEFPVGLNLIEAENETEKNFLVSELITIFYKLFDPNHTGILGPQFEHWLRNAALTIMADPEGGTMLEIPKLFTDKHFEAKKRQFVKDPLVQEFWTGQMAKTSEFHRSEMLNYFSSKFGHFTNDSMCRNIIGQTKSTIKMDDILAKGKILLVDLSKGKLGEITSQFLGLILLAKLQAAILRRSSLPQKEREPFFLYVDEFQNFTTDTFLSMLAESRKYGLGVHITNQYMAQLSDKVKSAVLGTVGTLLTFQVGSEDAEILAKQFEPFIKDDLLNLPNRNFYIRLMVNGQTSLAFSGRTLPNETVLENLKLAKDFPPAGSNNVITASRLLYGIPRPLVEALLTQRITTGA